MLPVVISRGEAMHYGKQELTARALLTGASQDIRGRSVQTSGLKARALYAAKKRRVKPSLGMDPLPKNDH
jgi:hypothetical protein